MSRSAVFEKTAGLGSGVAYVYREKPLAQSVRVLFLCFVAAVTVEGMPIGELALTKLIGVVFFLAYMATSGLPFKIALPKVQPPLYWFSVYFLAYACGALFAEYEVFLLYARRAIQIVQWLVFFWLACDVLRDTGFARKCLYTFMTGCIVVALGNMIGISGLSEEYAGSGRATAFEFNPNDLAALMAYAAIVVVGFCLNETKWSVKKKIVLLALTVPLFAVMASTGSRAGIAAFVIGMSAFFIPLRRWGKKWMATFCLAFLVLAGMAYVVLRDPVAAERWVETVQEGNTAGRDHIYAAAVDMISEKPIFGWGGPDAFYHLGLRDGRGRALDAHNMVLYLLLEVGLLGAVPFLVAVFLCVKTAWRARSGAFGTIPLALLVAALGYNMTHTGLHLKVFWLFLALGTAASAVTRKHPVVVVSLARGAMPDEGHRNRPAPSRVDRTGFRVP